MARAGRVIPSPPSEVLDRSSRTVGGDDIGALSCHRIYPLL